MAAVYILHSSILDKFYTGSCKDFHLRIEQHLSQYFPQAFTKKAHDWTIYLQIDNLSYLQARNIEAHIKKMKSKKYIQDLKRYPEILEKLISKYQEA